ncbi:formate dehydrogenase accessory sulfurtransferase FdhD [Nocardioides sp. YIM 152588]|uniref:formate dehydrogenase accessory sulfurtransferase FdhD n=1 Tax=Nocardioides sp. YIM 152588 TaxID=3158259 RepID=UPI0032E3D8CF
MTARRAVVRLRDGAVTRVSDALAVEEPMELRVDGRPLTVTMRTPGSDFDLAAGFLVSEGVVHSADQISAIRYCAGVDAEGRNTYNVVDVTLSPGTPAPAPGLQRSFATTSACGVCGKTSLDEVHAATRYAVADDPVRIAPSTLATLPERLRTAQRVFDRTGGLHAAGLFTADGRLLAADEDVGRHNAVDKVVGASLLAGRLPEAGRVLMVSGRASFELVQKALMAGIPILAAVSAPSSLAVDLAERNGMTLVGFLRGSSCNVYAGAERIADARA